MDIVPRSIHTVGVVGAGLMGSGIAEVCARAGYETLVSEASDALLQQGLERVEGSLATAVERGKLAAPEAAAVRGRIRGTVGLADFADRELVIEAVTENTEIKRDVFAQLDAICAPETILATNTSSIPIITMAMATRRPDRVLGMHFFIPAPVMRLLELVRALTTSDETLAVARGFGASLEKRVIVSQDRAGFIVNYLLIPYLNDAVRMVEESFASKEDIDVGMMVGTSYPMGPLTLLDYVGLDTALAVSEVMYAELKETRFAAPRLLRQMVAAGRLGRKSGRGFYDYANGERPPRG